MPAYLRPTTTDEALAALGSAPFTVLAGGTDFYPGRVDRPLLEDVLDITGIAELAGIRQTPRGWRIGATTTWAEVRDAPLPPFAQALGLAAREIGGEQIQNRATVAGNLCNASPAADGVPVLLALDARVELASVRGRRTLPIDAFVLGPRRTARAADELLTAILVPTPQAAIATSDFLKLGSRRYLVISFAMVAVAVEADGTGRIERARIAVGACSPVAIRLPAAEQALVGQPLDGALAGRVRDTDLAPLSPISDVRADADYRREAAGVMLRRALRRIGDAIAAERVA